jgi:hypothetical protein
MHTVTRKLSVFVRVFRAPLALVFAVADVLLIVQVVALTGTDAKT